MTKSDVYQYFWAEKSESLVFLIFGAGNILAALACLSYFRSKFAYGAAIPMLLVGLIQVVVGSLVYLRTDQQVESLAVMLEKSSVQYAGEELPGWRRSTAASTFTKQPK
jgi:hypothetical protein